MRSSPHQRNMGWREASRVLTVMSSVSGQYSMGPTGVWLQSNERVRRAISPVPKMKFCGRVWGAVRCSLLSRSFTVTNDSCRMRAFGSGDGFGRIYAPVPNPGTGFNQHQVRCVFCMGWVQGMERLLGEGAF